MDLEKLKTSFPYLQKINLVIVPGEPIAPFFSSIHDGVVSISNNVPCTDLSVGCDTSLNNVVECCDKIKQSAVSSSKVFFVEVMGTSGYLVRLIGN